MAIPNSHICVDPKLFLNKTNGLTKGSSMVMIIMEDLVVAVVVVVAERPPNMRYRSSTFRHVGAAYLADRSSTVRYVGGGGEIVRYFGGGDGAGDGANEDFGEHVGEHAGEDRGEHGSTVLFSSGSGDIGGDGEDEHRLCICWGQFSRRY